MSPRPVNHRANRNGPDTRHSLVHATDCHCFACRRPVSQEEFVKIQARDQARIAELTDRIKSQVLHERDAEIEKIRKDAAKREAAIRQQAVRAAEAALAPQIEKVKKDAAQAAEQQIKALKASQEAVISGRLLAQREALEKQKAKAVSDEKAKAYEEKLRLEEKLQGLTRQLQNKTAHELGEPAEFDLYETLQAEFGGDEIVRVGKGEKGPDIIMKVLHNGSVAGSIVIDCKNHKRWQSIFVKKLRNDQLDLGADFSILSTSTFPKNTRQLYLDENVIVADPARVTVITHLLRRHILQSCLLKLGSEGRNEKAARLLDFIVSPACTDLLDGFVKLTDELSALDRKEADSHSATWKKRGALILAVRNARDQFAEAVSRITHGSEPSP
jgi:hypothetical protein